jgi:hypothetical protein
MQSTAKSPAQSSETTEARTAAFLKVHARRPEPDASDTRFSARLALQRAFVAAPTD